MGAPGIHVEAADALAAEEFGRPRAEQIRRVADNYTRALVAELKNEYVAVHRVDVVNVARLAEMHLAAWEKTLRELGLTAATVDDRRKAIKRLLEAAMREVGDAQQGG